MKKQSLLFSLAAGVLLFGSMPTIQAGTVTNVIKKTAGVALGAVALGSAAELGYDFAEVDIDKNLFNPTYEVIGYGTLIFVIPMVPSYLLGSKFGLIESENYSIAVRLALIAATGYGSYKLLKPSIDEQEESEEGYSY